MGCAGTTSLIFGGPTLQLRGLKESDAHTARYDEPNKWGESSNSKRVQLTAHATDLCQISAAR